MNEFPKGAALVVGGSGGVGAAVCEALARAGTDVAVGYRSDRGAAEAVVARLTDMGVAAIPVFLDLALVASAEPGNAGGGAVDSTGALPGDAGGGAGEATGGLPANPSRGAAGDVTGVLPKQGGARAAAGDATVAVPAGASSGAAAGRAGRPAGSHSAAVAEAAAWRPLHTLIYAAGPAIPMQWVSKLSSEDLAYTLRIDVEGFFRVLRAALPHLRQSSGSIVAVTTAALVRFPSRDALSAVPKAALEALLRAVAKEEGRFGVRANSVAIGVVDAGMFKRLREAGELDDEWLAASRRNTPLGREATAIEVAEAVRFLASSRAGFITGQRLVVDGGYSV